MNLSNSVILCCFVGVFIFRTGVVASPPLQDFEPGVGFSTFILNERQEPVYTIPSPKHRLPRTVIPKHYKIKQRPILDLDNLSSRFTAPSEVTITIQCKQAVKEIVLHSHKPRINITTRLVKIIAKADGFEQGIVDQTFDEEKDFYIITLTNLLEVGESYDIVIPFTAVMKVSEFQRELVGLYVTHYQDSDNNKKYLSTTKLEPLHARKVFPCFDEPELKATFQVILGRHKDFHSLSNMPLETTEPMPGETDWFWDTFQTTNVKMSTYLVCMIVSDFDSETVEDGLFHAPVTTWANRETIAQGGGEYSADIVDKVLSFYEEKFKVPYSLPKMDSVTIPQVPSGAMENWGLITYREANSIFYPDIHTEADRDRIISVLSHELAHQWFGNLVTCKWWSDIWLNEGFATFIAPYGIAETAPEFDAHTRFVTKAVQSAMRTDQSSASHPVKKEPKFTGEIVAMFDNIAYGKGSSLIRMMLGFIGAEIFWKGVESYLTKFSERAVEQDDLFTILTEFTPSDALPEGLSVKDVMDTWTLKSGFPVLRVSATGIDRLKFSQEKFSLQQGDRQPNELWNIPITILTEKNPQFTTKPSLWLRKSEAMIPYSHPDLNTSQWIMVNPDGYGFYRVHYDTPLFDLIKTQLEYNHSSISPASRSQLLDDYFNFVPGGYAGLTSALELTLHLAKETELVVWNVVLLHLRGASERLSGSPEFLAFQHYLRPKVDEALSAVSEEDEGAKAILKALLMDWACYLGSVSCLRMSQELLEDWMRTGENATILPDIQSVVFCAGLTRKNVTTFEFLYSKYLEAGTHSTVRPRLLSALACTEDAEILTSLLEAATGLESAIELQEEDRNQVLKRIVANTKGRTLAYKFGTTNLERIGAAKFAVIVTSLSTYWHTQERLNLLKAFVEKNKDVLVDVMDSLIHSLDNVENNIAWKATSGTIMVNWMIEHHKYKKSNE